MYVYLYIWFKWHQDNQNGPLNMTFSARRIASCSSDDFPEIDWRSCVCVCAQNHSYKTVAYRQVTRTFIRAATYVSSCCYICVRILLHMCPHTAMPRRRISRSRVQSIIQAQVTSTLNHLYSFVD